MKTARPTVYMMDLLATVPYYTAYLSRALLNEGVAVRVGSISYYLDPGCFSSRGLRLDPGCVDAVGRFRLPRLPRRILKLAEGVLNLAALTVRFLVRPPAVLHVQYLPMLRWPAPLDFWFVLFCRWRGARVVLTVHDLLPHDTAERYRETFRRLYGSVDALICHSEHIQRRLEAEFGVAGEKIAVIPHGPFFYDLEGGGSEETLRAFGVDAGQTVVLWQGIIFPYKGLDLLLHAWQRVEAETDAASLVVVGTGAAELLEQVREQMAGLALKRVRLHPRFTSAEELVAIYRAADVVVYPYRAITTSGALATGLALGKTIVASDLPVFRELLTDGEDALLVEAQDAAALAGAMLRLIREPELRTRLAQAVAAKEFGARSWIEIARATERVYERVLGRAAIQ